MVSESYKRNARDSAFLGLNPCSSGRWSRRFTAKLSQVCATRVLILVLVEDDLGEVETRKGGCVLVS